MTVGGWEQAQCQPHFKESGAAHRFGGHMPQSLSSPPFFLTSLSQFPSYILSCPLPPEPPPSPAKSGKRCEHPQWPWPQKLTFSGIFSAKEICLVKPFLVFCRNRNVHLNETTLCQTYWCSGAVEFSAQYSVTWLIQRPIRDKTRVAASLLPWPCKWRYTNSCCDCEFVTAIRASLGNCH